MQIQVNSSEYLLIQENSLPIKGGRKGQRTGKGEDKREKEMKIGTKSEKGMGERGWGSKGKERKKDGEIVHDGWAWQRGEGAPHPTHALGLRNMEIRP